MVLPPHHALLNLGSVLSFMRLIWAVDHGLQRTSKRMASDLGFTGPQRLVIRILGRLPGISPSDLAEILHLHPSTLTGILRRLEARGAIRRDVDPKDSRRSLLFLTSDGRKLDVAVKGTVEDAVRRALAHSSPETIEQASRLLSTVASGLARVAAGNGSSARGVGSIGRRPRGTSGRRRDG